MAKAMPVYALQSLFNQNNDLDKKRDTIDAANTRLAETQSLSADEQTSILEYKDKLRLRRWPLYRDAIDAERKPVPSATRLSIATVDDVTAQVRPKPWNAAPNSLKTRSLVPKSKLPPK